MKPNWLRHLIVPCRVVMRCPVTEGVGALYDAAIRPSVCLSHAPLGKMVLFRHTVMVRRPNGNSILVSVAL